MRGVSPDHKVRRVLPSPILSASAGILAALMFVISVVILLRGHNAPGGGFIGGLVCAGALVILSYGYGARAARRVLPLHPMTIAGVGLAIALLSGLPALLEGLPYLTHLWDDLQSEFGIVKVGTTYLFDLGVFLVVAGAVAAFFLLFEEG